ncbi:MAG TPA: BON domain-containing protein [Isosphaeraceae bacterium]|jgi:osmotically-inducible protein OsmY|nr:BON domain-containing protein [Isosphaeraceae bacterium]
MVAGFVAESIEDKITERFRVSGYLILEDVACDVRGDSVVLSGRLPSHYLKQVAQAIVAEVEGVGRVVNLIHVAPPSARPC